MGSGEEGAPGGRGWGVKTQTKSHTPLYNPIEEHCITQNHTTTLVQTCNKLRKHAKMP